MTEFEEIAEPYRFNFEISWEVANKGEKDIKWLVALLQLLINVIRVLGIAEQLVAVMYAFRRLRTSQAMV